MKVKYSRFRHNAKQTSFTSPTGPRRQGGEQEYAQYPTNDDVTSCWSCRRPENVSILSSLVTVNNGPIQDFVHPDDHAQPTYKMTSGFNLSQFHTRWSVIEIRKS